MEAVPKARKEQTMASKTWDSFHRRGEVLRAFVDETNARRDGVLPMELPGIAETFGDEFNLIAALQLRWHTRLAGRIEQALADRPADLESAVLTAWRATASELAGVRLVLDRALDEPTSDEVATALRRARTNDWTLLAAMSGRAGVSDPGAAGAGRDLEERARLAFHPTAPPRHRADDARGSLVGRLKAALAA
jgi:hypothetical protein